MMRPRSDTWAKAFEAGHTIATNSQKDLVIRQRLIRPSLIVLGAAFLALIAAALILTWFLSVQPRQSISVSDASIYAITATGSGSLSFTLDNAGVPARLVSAEVRGAEHSKIVIPFDAEIFGGEGSENIALPGQTKLQLKSGAAHVALHGLDPALVEGALIPFVLVFDDASKLRSKARLSMVPKGSRHLGASQALTNPVSLQLSLKKQGEGWQLEAEAKGIKLDDQALDQPHQDGQGHGHVYLNGTQLGRIFAEPISIGSLPSGQHRVRVSLFSNDHRQLRFNNAPVTATREISQP